jgi:site-specific DNA-cytosine methylase
MQKLRTIDLFSGVGGMALGLRAHCEVVQYCENDPYCRTVLQKRMAAGDLDDAPIQYDVRDFETVEGQVDMVTAGFPCQVRRGERPYHRGWRSRV